MKYAWFPGCVARGACPELYTSMKNVCAELGIELVEMKKATCTGSGFLHERNPELADTLNARTMAMAEEQGLPMLTNCSTCQGVMSLVGSRLEGDSQYKAKINANLAEEGLQYQGRSQPKIFLWALLEDLGLAELERKVKRPLEGIQAAPFYGCYILRPSSILGFDDQPQRATALEQIITTVGATPVDYAGKTKCCGFPIMTINRTNSLTMTANHVNEAQQKGADFMVTPCPLCHLNLDTQQPDAAKISGRSLDLPVLHLPQMVGLALGFTPKEMALSKNVVSTDRLSQMLGTRP